MIEYMVPPVFVFCFAKNSRFYAVCYVFLFSFFFFISSYNNNNNNSKETPNEEHTENSMLNDGIDVCITPNLHESIYGCA